MLLCVAVIHGRCQADTRPSGKHMAAELYKKAYVLREQKAKRKPGRPLAYQGDPFSPDVTPEERRVILRRIANRESARRVRVRHNETVERAFKEASCAVTENAAVPLCCDFAEVAAQ